MHPVLDDLEKQTMLCYCTWEEFRNDGMLWWVNRVLHLFGYVIVLQLTEEGEVSKIFPAKIKFSTASNTPLPSDRSLTSDSESDGFLQVTNYLKNNIDVLVKDANE